MGHLIAIAAGALFGWLGYRLSKGRKLAAAGGVLLGLLVAFYVSGRQDYSQTALLPLVHIEVPASFHHDTVIFIVDPMASTEFSWSKDGEGRVKASKSGIIRAKSLGPLEHRESRALLSDGRHDWDLFDSYLDDSTNFLAYGFNSTTAPRADIRRRGRRVPPEAQIGPAPRFRRRPDEPRAAYTICSLEPPREVVRGVLTR